MPTMKILQINDPHFAERPPSKRTLSYTDDIFEKMEECIEISKQFLVDIVVIPGDIFHYKSGIRTSHRLVNRLSATFEKFPVPILVVPGNHDLLEDRIESVQSQPIGTLAFVKNVTILPKGQLPLGRVQFRAIPGVSSVKPIDFFEDKGNFAVSIIIAHAMIVPPGDRWYPLEVIRPSALAGSADVILYGHNHIPADPHLMGGTLFVNPGAISRGTLSEEDLKRTPQVAIITIETSNEAVQKLVSTNAQYIKLRSAKPTEVVYHMDVVSREEKTEEAMETFLASLGSSQVEMVTRESLQLAIDNAEVDPVIKKTAKSILDAV
jgi:DNA repair exonuclease SbcCD nuclease subunit